MPRFNLRFLFGLTFAVAIVAWTVSNVGCHVWHGNSSVGAELFWLDPLIDDSISPVDSFVYWEWHQNFFVARLGGWELTPPSPPA